MALSFGLFAAGSVARRIAIPMPPSFLLEKAIVA